MNQNGQTEYTAQRQARAGTRAVLRVVVSGYLAYLGYTLIRNFLRGDSALPPAAAWGAGLVFITAGLGFAIYTLLGWRAEYRQAAQDAESAEAVQDAGNDDEESVE